MSRVTTRALSTAGARFHQLDVLRGLAVLAVLVININGMGGSSHTGRLPETLGWTVADQIVWSVRQIFISGTARCLLELVFGAGMILLTTTLARNGDAMAVARRFWVRYLLLFLIGLFHVFALSWYGDFLHIYAIAALIAFPFRRLRGAQLVLIGSTYAIALAASALIGSDGRVTGTLYEVSGNAGHAAKLSPGQTMAPWRANAVTVAPDLAAAQREDRERTTTIARWHEAMLDDYVALFNWGWVIYGLGEAAATMMIGAGLFKLGVVQGQRSTAFYARLAAVAYGVGLAIRIPPVWAGHVPSDPTQIDAALREIGRLSLTLGHVALVSLALRNVRGRRLLMPFAAAGRTALSLYVAQTLICLWLLFPPFGLRLYGRMDWIGLIGTAVMIDVLLLAAANQWLSRYRIGPLEWLWRSLASGERLALHRPVGLDRATVTN